MAQACLMEGMRLRIKDVDLIATVIVVREAKGNKDRVVIALVRWHRAAGSLQPARSGGWIGNWNLQVFSSRTRWK
jgi:hypothetical protein